MADPSDMVEPELSPSATDRRTGGRFRCRLAFNCAASAQTPPLACPASVRDISATGIGLVTSQPFPSGTMLTIELSQEEQVVLSRPLRIKHVRKEGPASWFLGGSFPDRLTKKEMKLFY
jgi:hypothetical protein